MSLSSPHMSLPYLTNLCSSPLHPAAIVDILSELEAGVQFDASAASAASPDHLKLVSTYYSVYLLSLLLDADL